RADPSAKLLEITDSKTVMGGALEWKQRHEDQGYILQKNAHLERAIVAALRNRKARTAFKWVKGHRGHPLNEMADKLAGEASSKPTPDELTVEIPSRLMLSGAKLSCMTQKLAYRAIRSLKERNLCKRRRTETNLANVASGVKATFGVSVPSAAIWKAARSRHITFAARYFIWMAIHDGYMIGDKWLRPNMTDEQRERAICRRCENLESMDHVLFRCEAVGQSQVWALFEELW
ncbi:hypothetical protein BD310DRAFT_775735, partial [Dichomitus squalens]